MKDEVHVWLDYAAENLSSAKVLLEAQLFNPCLQNVQQSIEKYLKALLLDRCNILQKTHSITTLVNLLAENNIVTYLTEDDCALLDSIYLPSKYPLAGVLPEFIVDDQLCRECLTLAESLALEVSHKLT